MNNKSTNETKAHGLDRKPRANRRPHWRKVALLLFCLGSALVVFRGTATAYAQGLLARDAVYIPESRHVFRDQKEGALSHTFRIYNLRARYLSVKAETGCGCTEVSWEQATIAPFSWQNITATLESTPKKEVSSSVTLKTNSEANPYPFVRLVKTEGEIN